MVLRRSKPTIFRPKGLSDTVDSTNTFAGAMQTLANLIPANNTDYNWVCRPAGVEISAYPGFTTPGFVSAALVVGNIEYGMVASGLNGGHDQPYAYNLLTNTFLTVNGITTANTPTSPAATGAWTPPIMCVVGTRIVVTHPGFPGGAIKFGWFDISGYVGVITSACQTFASTAFTSTTNLLQAGVQPGQLVSGPGGLYPAGTTVVSIAMDGLSGVTSQASTAGTTGPVTFTFTGGTKTAPLWGAGDTNIVNLPSTPVSVAQFNGRAFYAVGNGVVFSDSLLACNVTNADQALTFGNGLAVTALGGLPLLSPVTGGIVQAMIAFQGVSGMQQITGDQATSNLAVNLMNVATGTLAPLSIVPTNFGLSFISPEGLRIVEFSGQVSDPIGDHGTGVAVPFIAAVQPSRICSAATADVLRISVQNGELTTQPNQEYWFDITRKVWSGPHTFPASLIQPWGSTFVVHPIDLPGTIWRSDVEVSVGTVYVENGSQLSWRYQTSLMPDNQGMCENSMIETTIMSSLPPGASYTISANDEEGSPIGVVTLVAIGTNTPWGNFLWGAALWGGVQGVMKQRQVEWTDPLVFKQASLSISGLSEASVQLGNNYFRIEELGYLLQ